MRRRKKRPYRGWFGQNARRRCPHSRLIGLHGDEINRKNGYRIRCDNCKRYLDGPVKLVQTRIAESSYR